MLTSVALIEPLGWRVFVEQPVSEVNAKLDASIVRTALLLLAGLLLSAFGALALARGMVRPIRTLDEGARRIGAGDLDQKIDVRTGDELQGLAEQFNRMTGKLRESYAGLERKVDERTRELKNSLEQQTAISEILRVISSSPTDVQPVLQAVAERAAHLCDAPFARVMVDRRRDAASAWRITRPSQCSAAFRCRVARTSFTGRAVVDRATVHFADIVPIADAEFPGCGREHPRAWAAARCWRSRCSARVAHTAAYSCFAASRGCFHPTRWRWSRRSHGRRRSRSTTCGCSTETKEALEQQTAISEILRVISSSPTDVQPVLDAVAERAAHLCGAPYARVLLIEGDVMRPVTDIRRDRSRCRRRPRRFHIAVP